LNISVAANACKRWFRASFQELKSFRPGRVRVTVQLTPGKQNRSSNTVRTNAYVIELQAGSSKRKRHKEEDEDYKPVSCQEGLVPPHTVMQRI
jgi:hypothetical protein